MCVDQGSQERVVKRVSKQKKMAEADDIVCMVGGYLLLLTKKKKGKRNEE